MCSLKCSKFAQERREKLAGIECSSFCKNLQEMWKFFGIARPNVEEAAVLLGMQKRL